MASKGRLKKPRQARDLALQIIRAGVSIFGLFHRRPTMKPLSTGRKPASCKMHLTFPATESSCYWYLEKRVDMYPLPLISEVGAERRTDCLSGHDAFPRFTPSYLLARMELPGQELCCQEGDITSAIPLELFETLIAIYIRLQWAVSQRMTVAHRADNVPPQWHRSSHQSKITSRTTC